MLVRGCRLLPFPSAFVRYYLDAAVQMQVSRFTVADHAHIFESL